MDLPPEIRDLIWEATLPGPRTISLLFGYERYIGPRKTRYLIKEPFTRQDADGTTTSVSDDPKWTDRELITSNTPPPSIHGVCREARRVVFERFNRLDDFEFGNAIFVDPINDIIHLRDSSGIHGPSNVLLRGLRGVERLAVELKNFLFVIDSDFERPFGFQGLKEINLILHNGKATQEHYTKLDTQYELIDAPDDSIANNQSSLDTLSEDLAEYMDKHKRLDRLMVNFKVLIADGSPCCKTANHQ